MSDTTDDLEAHGDPEYWRGEDRWDRLILDGIWVTASGRETPIKEMQDTHLFNLLWMLKRRGQRMAYDILMQFNGNMEEDGAWFAPESEEPPQDMDWLDGYDDHEQEGIKILLVEYALRRFHNACEGKDDSDTLGLDKGRERRGYAPDRRQREPGLLDGADLRARGDAALDKLRKASRPSTAIRRKGGTGR